MSEIIRRLPIRQFLLAMVIYFTVILGTLHAQEFGDFAVSQSASNVATAWHTRWSDLAQFDDGLQLDL